MQMVKKASYAVPDTSNVILVVGESVTVHNGRNTMDVKNVDRVLCMVVDEDLQIPCERLVRLPSIQCGRSMLT